MLIGNESTVRRALALAAVFFGIASLLGTTAEGVAQARSKPRPTMLYLGDTKQNRYLYLAHPGSPSKRTPVHTPAHTIVEGATLSPDGKHIAELLLRLRKVTTFQRATQLAVTDRNGRRLRILVRRRAVYDFYDTPVWSPDSATLYFSRTPASTPHVHDAQLFSLDTHSNHPKPKAVLGGSMLQAPAASPDGTMLAAIRATYDDSGFITETALVTLNLVTGEQSAPLLATPNDGSQLADPAWSPDGSRIAVTRFTGTGARDNVLSRIDVVAADGSDDAVPIIAADGGSRLSVRAPAWRSPDQLWFMRNFESEGNTDSERHSTPADLFSVDANADGFSTPTRRTHTKHLGEFSLSFSR